MAQNPPNTPEGQGEGKQFDHLVADAAHHVLERRDAQAVAEKPRTPKARKPLLIVLLMAFVGVAVWNALYFSRMGKISADLEETYLETTIYLTALSLDAEYEATGAYPATLQELAMDEEGLTYTPGQNGYTLRLEGERATLEYRSGEDLTPYRESFEALQSGEMTR